jgi:protein-S-isoprenylcysteine O-methyltransferase Ste14
MIGLMLESLAICLAFVFHLPIGTMPAWPRLLAAAILAAPSIALAWSAVHNLGKQFRVTAGLYVDHELVQSGAYGVIRHPIYGTLLGMLIVSMLAVTRVEWMAPLIAMFLVGTEIRVRTEDGLLESRFGEEFRRYRQRVRAYIPFVR